MQGPNLDESTPAIDPYRNFKFRVIWEGRTIAGFNKVGGLTRAMNVISHRQNGITSPPPQAAQSEYQSITLERGITYDAAFETWANKVWVYASNTGGDDNGQALSLMDFRRDLTVELHNEVGEVVITYLIHRCWASEFLAFPELDATGNAVGIQSMKLENEGWERVVRAAGNAPPSPFKT